MSNDSSYSIFPEDGVEVRLMNDNSPSRISIDPDDLEGSPQASHASVSDQCESNKLPSLSFEAQVDSCNSLPLVVWLVTLCYAQLG